MTHKLILIKLSIQLTDIWTAFGILTIFTVKELVAHFYSTEMQLNNSTDTEAPVLDLNLSISKGVISSTIYDKRGDSEFDMNYFPFVDSDVPLLMMVTFLILFGLQECLIIWLIAVLVTKRLLPNISKRGIGIINFGKLYRRHYELFSKYDTWLKHICYKAYRNLIYYDDLVYKIRKNVGKPEFSDQFSKIIMYF